MVRSEILALSLMLLDGCSRTPPGLTTRPATEQQGLVAAGSALRMRDQFNRNDCLGIYSEASASFRSQRTKDWVNGCEALRIRFGSWRNYTIQAAVVLSGHQLCSTG